ncbi:hypothetical protein Mal4_56210 [Maioricimonas rarisocia]|uniref:Uncharacterized protein n=1 Tax=Maioricimonas rarisocia TaxID=2528026 RepID=A0A517ZFK4_9PLAN|nr:type VI secretion system tube protein Hcp [Maioricimonas rarisocia]QDU41256.1 hypothetical protein Mal4_56210 [Maioricimonas rarisocia]
MPGFLIFDELGIDPDMPFASAAKTALSMLPGSWMLHGLGGEYNVDVDPIAEINKTLDGGGHLGSMASSAEGAAESAAEGDAVGAIDGALGVVGEFWDAYQGWIPVVSVSQTVPSAAEQAREAAMSQLERFQQETMERTTAVAQQVGREAAEQVLRTNGPNGDANPATRGTSGSVPDAVTGFRSIDGVDRITAEIQLDVSFPRLLKAALKEKPAKVFDAAELHLCTVSTVDLRQLTFNSDSTAARLIRTLVGFHLFNVVPYLSISMRDVQIMEVSYNLLGDAEGSVPTANVNLRFEEVTWTYHVINGSNMNLYNIDFNYDIRKRKPPSGGFSLGSMINPFA